MDQSQIAAGLDLAGKGIAATVALIVGDLALKGFKHWFPEHRARERFRVAQEVTAKSYRLRDQIALFRRINPARELVKLKAAEGPPEEFDKRQEVLKILEPFLEAWRELGTSAAEAEVLFRRPGRIELDKLLDVAREFYFAVDFCSRFNPEMVTPKDPELRKDWNILVGISPRKGTSIEQSTLEDDRGFAASLVSAIDSIDLFYNREILDAEESFKPRSWLLVTAKRLFPRRSE